MHLQSEYLPSLSLTILPKYELFSCLYTVSPQWEPNLWPWNLMINNLNFYILVFVSLNRFLSLHYVMLCLVESYNLISVSGTEIFYPSTVFQEGVWANHGACRILNFSTMDQIHAPWRCRVLTTDNQGSPIHFLYR